MGCGCGAKGVQRITAQPVPQVSRPQHIIQTRVSAPPRAEAAPIANTQAAPQSLKCPKCNSHTVRVNISGRTRIQCSNNQCRKILS